MAENNDHPSRSHYRPHVNEEDREIIEAERDASPERWAYLKEGPQKEQLHKELAGHESHDNAQQEEEERQDSVSSVSSVDAASRRPSHMLRTTSTQVEKDVFAYLERHPTAIKRIHEYRLQHSETVGTTRSRAGKALPDFGGGKAYPPTLPDQEKYVVEFSGHEDPAHPQNWKLNKKLYITAIMIFNSFGATLSSAIFSPTTQQIEQEFNVGQEVTVLGTSLFVLGYALGPILWGPTSELYGRRLPTIIAMTLFGIFLIAVAISKDIQTLLICRFFAGAMGSAALILCPSTSTDMFSNKVRGIAVAVFSATVFNGPLLGPMIGGFIVSNQGLGWRWTSYIPSFIAFAGAILSFFFQEETYPPTILVSKAQELRRLTKNWGIHAKQDEVEVDFKELVSKNVGRPLRVLFTEPIVFMISLYMSFLYGILYLSLTAYSIVYNQIYGFQLGVSGLPYIGFIVGVTIGLAATLAINPDYVKRLDKNDNVPVPEWRLFLVMPAGIIFAIGLFWFGWTGFTNSIPWIVPTLAGLALGFGIYCVFVHLLNYIIDAYLMFAASAIAANTILRSLFGAVFPLFATYMFEGIGIQWGMTFLGCVAAVAIPMPFLFYRYGKKIRAKSKFAPAPDIEKDKRRDEESRGQAEDSGHESLERKETKEE